MCQQQEFCNELTVSVRERLKSIKNSAYDLAGPSGQYAYARLQFALGARPSTNETAPGVKWPSTYRACVVFSADFELAWGWQYVKGVPDAHALALQKAQQARQNLPILLDLFDRYEVPVTWATIGHLFLEGCDRNGHPHAEIERLPYFENEHWRYAQGDWFDADPCSDFRADPAWYAPDLLQNILSRRVKHEIGCHTFSHIDCSDIRCPSEVLDSELGECRRLAAEWGLSLKSFVFPGNSTGNLSSLKKHGFAAYRWHGRHQLDVPQQDELGLWRVPGGICWEKPAGWPVEAWVRVLKRCVATAIETGTVLHLWFHPSCAPLNLEVVFPSVLEYVQQCSVDVVTMNRLSQQLKSARNQRL